MNHAPLPEQERYLEQASVRLRGLSPREVAMLIRSLDSRLTGISYQQQAGEQLLIYTFEVAGKVQSFQVAVTPDAIESITDLYPGAAMHEQDLRQFGLIFNPPPND